MKRIVLFVAAFIIAVSSLAVRPAFAVSETKPEPAPIAVPNPMNAFCKFAVSHGLVQNFVIGAWVTSKGVARFTVTANNYIMVGRTLGIPLGHMTNPTAVTEFIGNQMSGGKILDKSAGRVELDLEKSYGNEPCGPDDPNSWQASQALDPGFQSESSFGYNFALDRGYLVQTFGILAYVLMGLAILVALIGGKKLVLG